MQLCRRCYFVQNKYKRISPHVSFQNGFNEITVWQLRIANLWQTRHYGLCRNAKESMSLLIRQQIQVANFWEQSWNRNLEEKVSLKND